MQRYRTTINIGQAPVSATHDILDMARQHGEAHIDDTVNLVVIHEVGDSKGIADLWDLRDVIEELNANLSSYFDTAITKPELVEP